jgi:hypothetical protein
MAPVTIGRRLTAQLGLDGDLQPTEKLTALNCEGRLNATPPNGTVLHGMLTVRV